MPPQELAPSGNAACHLLSWVPRLSVPTATCNALTSVPPARGDQKACPHRSQSQVFRTWNKTKGDSHLVLFCWRPIKVHLSKCQSGELSQLTGIWSQLQQQDWGTYTGVLSTLWLTNPLMTQDTKETKESTSSLGREVIKQEAGVLEIKSQVAKS